MAILSTSTTAQFYTIYNYFKKNLQWKTFVKFYLMQLTPDTKKEGKMSAQNFCIVKIFCLSYRIVAHIARENISLEQREVWNYAWFLIPDKITFVHKRLHKSHFLACCKKTITLFKASTENWKNIPSIWAAFSCPIKASWHKIKFKLWIR